MNRLQRLAWAQPFNDDRRAQTPAILLLPGGLAVGLSLNH